MRPERPGQSQTRRIRPLHFLRASQELSQDRIIRMEIIERPVRRHIEINSPTALLHFLLLPDCCTIPDFPVLTAVTVLRAIDLFRSFIPPSALVSLHTILPSPTSPDFPRSISLTLTSLHLIPTISYASLSSACLFPNTLFPPRLFFTHLFFTRLFVPFPSRLPLLSPGDRSGPALFAHVPLIFTFSIPGLPISVVSTCNPFVFTTPIATIHSLQHLFPAPIPFIIPPSFPHPLSPPPSFSHRPCHRFPHPLFPPPPRLPFYQRLHSYSHQPFHSSSPPSRPRLSHPYFPPLSFYPPLLFSLRPYNIPLPARQPPAAIRSHSVSKRQPSSGPCLSVTVSFPTYLRAPPKNDPRRYS